VAAGHARAAVPADRVADIAAFLSEQRNPPPPAEPLGINTVKLWAVAIRYLHYLARFPSPTGTAEVSETLAGLTREAGHNGDGPRPKLPTRVGILREIVAAIGGDLRGLPDRALLLVGFAGAFRRSELARIRIEHLEETEHGLRITLPLSKGDRAMKGTVVGIPYGRSELCPVRALRRWQQVADITDGPLFRRIRTTPRPAAAPASPRARSTTGAAATPLSHRGRWRSPSSSSSHSPAAIAIQIEETAFAWHETLGTTPDAVRLAVRRLTL
jgi:integrase